MPMVSLRQFQMMGFIFNTEKIELFKSQKKGQQGQQ